MAKLIFHHGALGDWVLTFGLMRAMRGPMTAITHWSKAQLAAKLLPHVEPMDMELREFGRLFAEGGPAFTSPAIGTMFAEADVIISFVSRGDDAWAANVKKLAPSAQLAFVFPRPPVDFAGHVWQWHAEQLDKQGLMIEQVVAASRSNPSGPIVLHPGSGGEAKCWPAERYITLAQRLIDRGHTVRFVIGEVERERWKAAKLAAFQAVCEVAVPTSPLALAAIIEHARAYVGNDSGPTHLAAELGVPTVALFGPSDARQWSPCGPQVTMLKPAEPAAMDWLEVDVVDAAVQAVLDVRP
jgi:ADP-heptose:LPS heptosyltransferase